MVQLYCTLGKVLQNSQTLRELCIESSNCLHLVVKKGPDKSTTLVAVSPENMMEEFKTPIATPRIENPAATEMEYLRMEYKKQGLETAGGMSLIPSELEQIEIIPELPIKGTHRVETVEKKDLVITHKGESINAVSYTHLTLPTICSV
eukprot:TRINITY_DN5143_c0_g2_i8.p3 TRINITY_DN5143_c0_g2~~TRINITY_DN5143_c0_g2_i8.p3  ORF type:complete len:148 (-),score=17.14 TRINITY_DN5143_c0_g2_i8:46-489(-)